MILKKKNKFRISGGQEVGKRGDFCFATYLVGTDNDFHQCVILDAHRHNWSAGNIQIIKQMGNHLDPMNRYLVICKATPRNQVVDASRIERKSWSTVLALP